MRSSHTSSKSSRCLLQLEKAGTQQRRLNAAKNKQILKKPKWLYHLVPFCIPTINKQMRVLIALHPCQKLVLSVFFIFATLIHVCNVFFELISLSKWFSIPFLLEIKLYCWSGCRHERRERIYSKIIWQFDNFSINNTIRMISCYYRLCTSVLRAACFSFKFPSEAHRWFRGVKYSGTTLFFFLSS